LSDLAEMLRGMTQISAGADRAVARVLRQQAGLITRSQVLTSGLTEAGLRHRIRAGGPWRTVLPGVYLGHNGSLGGGQRELAAVLYAGSQCVITGLSALQSQGVRTPLSDVIDVLIPDASKRQSTGFVRTHRTLRLPERPLERGGIRWAPVPRAVADTSRAGLELGEVRALVAEAVQRRACTVGELAQELRGGPRRGSGMLRAVLAEVAEGVASAAEGDLRKLIRSGRLPEPLYNPDLYAGSQFLARPDVWWKDAGVAGEMDSREWHLSPAQWRQTMERHARMSAQGIIVLHVTPGRVRTDGPQVVAELRSAIEAGRRRPPLAIRTVPGH
jgi:hypothetical protein